MLKQLVLHDTESGKVIEVSAVSVIVLNNVVSSGFVEYSGDINADLAKTKLTVPLKGTPIEWKDENGGTHRATVTESRDEINEKKRAALGH